MLGGRGGVALHGTMFVEASLNEYLCRLLSSDMRQGEIEKISSNGQIRHLKPLKGPFAQSQIIDNFSKIVRLPSTNFPLDKYNFAEQPKNEEFVCFQ